MKVKGLIESQSNGGNELPRNLSDYLGVNLKSNNVDDEAIDDEIVIEDDDDDEEENVENINNNASNGLSFFDKECVWVSPYSLGTSGKRRFVHYYCALFSPLVGVFKNQWHNVRSEVSRGQCLTCSICEKRGATLGCIVKRCNRVVHIPCAMRNGFRYTKSFLCEEHQQLQLDFEHAADIAEEGDISKGKEALPISLALAKKTSSGLVLPSPTASSSSAFERAGIDLEYITENMDSEDVVTNNRNVHELIDFCSCEVRFLLHRKKNTPSICFFNLHYFKGMCDDVDDCECLQSAGGRNYTYGGSLLPDLKVGKKIIECNLRCNCSVR